MFLWTENKWRSSQDLSRLSQSHRIELKSHLSSVSIDRSQNMVIASVMTTFGERYNEKSWDSEICWNWLIFSIFLGINLSCHTLILPPQPRPHLQSASFGPVLFEVSELHLQPIFGCWKPSLFRGKNLKYIFQHSSRLLCQ